MPDVSLADQAQVADVDLLGVDELAQHVLALLDHGLAGLGRGLGLVRVARARARARRAARARARRTRATVLFLYIAKSLYYLLYCTLGKRSGYLSTKLTG